MLVSHGHLPAVKRVTYQVPDKAWLRRVETGRGTRRGNKGKANKWIKQQTGRITESKQPLKYRERKGQGVQVSIQQGRIMRISWTGEIWGTRCTGNHIRSSRIDCIYCADVEMCQLAEIPIYRWSETKQKTTAVCKLGDRTVDSSSLIKWDNPVEAVFALMSDWLV